MEHAKQEKLAESNGPIGWYVHLPFCRTKCGYCDFYSLPTLPHLIDDLIGAITREIELRDPRRAVETIFVGGGTPTELPGEALQKLLGYVSNRTGPVGEWTVEANPSSTTDLKLEVLQTAGVNRISFGAQSFHEDDLRVLERIHDPVHIGESVRAARAAGFENVNLDLIYGIPGQSVARWRETLARAIDLGPDHLSCYSLMYEDGTALTRLKRDGNLTPCDEDVEAEMFDVTIETLTAAGYMHYEISNFAREGRVCRANIIYWENREYLGVGPSAVSYLNGERRKNIPDVRKYCEWMTASPESIAAEREELSPRERAGETAVQMLRLTRGIDLRAFERRTGIDASVLFAEPIRRFSEMGLVDANSSVVRLTHAGLLVSNRVMQEFLTTETSASRRLTVLPA